MSQYALAKVLGVPEMRISELVNGKRGTFDTALRLARYFGTSHDFWLGMQMTLEDLEQARERAGAAIDATVHPRAA